MTSPGTARPRSTSAAARLNASTRCSKTPGVKLSSVATDILGKSGRDMLEALVCGTRDPEILAELARGVLRKKIPQLRLALEGRFSTHHALIVGQILAKLDFLDEAIGTLSGEIDRVIAPFGAEVELLDTIPGVDRRIAECLIAEIGVDMGRFETSARLASWAGMCPGNHESAGKRKSGKTRKGSKWLVIGLLVDWLPGKWGTCLEWNEAGIEKTRFQKMVIQERAGRRLSKRPSGGISQDVRS